MKDLFIFIKGFAAGVLFVAIFTIVFIIARGF